MVVPAIALFFGLMVIAIAIRANVVLRQEDRVPMQWGITGEVNWTAPRLILLVSGAGLVAAQLLHLWLVFKTLHRSGK